MSAFSLLPGRDLRDERPKHGSLVVASLAVGDRESAELEQAAMKDAGMSARIYQREIRAGGIRVFVWVVVGRERARADLRKPHDPDSCECKRCRPELHFLGDGE